MAVQSSILLPYKNKLFVYCNYLYLYLYSGISWTICKKSFTPCSRQITMLAPHHSLFTGRMLFLMPNRQCQSTEGIKKSQNYTQLFSMQLLATNSVHTHYLHYGCVSGEPPGVNLFPLVSLFCLHQKWTFGDKCHRSFMGQTVLPVT